MTVNRAQSSDRVHRFLVTIVAGFEISRSVGQSLCTTCTITHGWSYIFTLGVHDVWPYLPSFIRFDFCCCKSCAVHLQVTVLHHLHCTEVSVPYATYAKNKICYNTYVAHKIEYVGYVCSSFDI